MTEWMITQEEEEEIFNTFLVKTELSTPKEVAREVIKKGLVGIFAAHWVDASEKREKAEMFVNPDNWGIHDKMLSDKTVYVDLEDLETGEYWGFTVEPFKGFVTV